MRILLALDTSEVSERAAAKLATWPGLASIEVHMVSVIKPDEAHDVRDESFRGEFMAPIREQHTPRMESSQYGGAVVPTPEPQPATVEDRGQALERARSEREDYLRGVAARDFSATKVTTGVEFSEHVAEAIIAAARENNADAIAMGTHGRSGISRALMGSVAEGVVRESPVPVILIGPQAISAA